MRSTGPPTTHHISVHGISGAPHVIKFHAKMHAAHCRNILNMVPEAHDQRASQQITVTSNSHAFKAITFDYNLFEYFSIIPWYFTTTEVTGTQQYRVSPYKTHSISSVCAQKAFITIPPSTAGLNETRAEISAGKTPISESQALVHTSPISKPEFRPFQWTSILLLRCLRPVELECTFKRGHNQRQRLSIERNQALSSVLQWTSLIP